MKHLKLALTATTICAGVALGVTGVNAETQDNSATQPEAEAIYAPAINIADALSTAKAAVAGSVEAIFLEETDLGHVYIAELFDELNSSTLVIDANTGDIVAKFSMEVSSPEYLDLLDWDDEDYDDDDWFEADFDDEDDLQDMMMILNDMGYTVEPVAVN